MIDEILVEIKAAEAKADDMQKEAYQKGKDIVLTAEIEAEKQKKATVAECKADIKAATVAAEEKAVKKRAEILKIGEINAQKLVEEKASVIDSAADSILNMLLKKY